MSDKKISELPIATAISASDISVLVDNGTDYQYTFTLLLQFLEANLTTGANISFGTILPQNTAGNNGDVFVNTAVGSFAQKISGTWTVVYTLPAANGADGTLLYGAGMPGTSVGKNSDSYINTLTGIFYQKTAGAWSQVFSMATGPQGPQGTAGTNGTNGIDGNTILFGTVDPSNSTTGVNGNFYINTTTYKLFGPKTAGVWGSGVSLIGSGLPGGGTAGQILAKADGTDFNTIWEDNSFANLTGQPADNANMTTALNGKVDKVTGFGLSSNDYTSAEKTKLASLTKHYQGKYSSLSALQTAIPAGSDGDYAIVVGSPNDQEYIWDGDHTSWVTTENIPASTFAALGGSPSDNASLNSVLNSKENSANKDAVDGYAGLDGSGNFNKTTDNLNEGTSNLYFTAARVLAAILTGIGFSSATAVLATDTILQAVGKLQAQITALFKIPAGGAAGQVLSKIDGTDGNTQWANVLLPGNNLSDVSNSSTAQKNLGVASVFRVSRVTTGSFGDYVEIGKINDPGNIGGGWNINEVLLKVIVSSDATGGTTVGFNGAVLEYDIALNYWTNSGIWQTINPLKLMGLSSSACQATRLQAYYINPGDGTGYIKLRLWNYAGAVDIGWNVTIICYQPFNTTFTPTNTTGNDTTAYTTNGMMTHEYIVNQLWINSLMQLNAGLSVYGNTTLNGSTSGSTLLKAAPAAAGTVVLPAALPTTSGQYVQSDTSGNWSYSSVVVSVASGDFTAQTANKTIATFTIGASTAYFRVNGYINVTAIATDVIQLQVVYTDENNTARTAIFYSQGTTTPGLSTIGNSSFPALDIRCKNGTTITVSATLTTSLGSITYDCGARIQQL
jgi:hypothetical protein